MPNPSRHSAPAGRRAFLRTGAAALAGAALAPFRAPGVEPPKRTGSAIRLSCAAYSFRTYLDLKKPAMTLTDFIDLCAEWGIPGTELTSYYFPKTDPAYLHELKARAFEQGLTVSGTAIRNNFALPPGAARDKELAHVRAWIDHAAEFGAPVIRIFGGTTPKGATDEQAVDWVVECIEACGPKCAERGVYLALENHGGFSAKADRLLEVARRVTMPWFGVNLDTGNFADADNYESIARTAPYAINVQLKMKLLVDGARRDTDIPRVFDILRQTNYRGWLALEYEESEDPKVAVPRVLDRMRELAG